MTISFNDLKRGRRLFHMSQSVKGAIANWPKEEWRRVARSNKMTVTDLKELFKTMDLEGKVVIPIGDHCKGFSYTTGCPGHEITDDNPGGKNGRK